jgi:hypothetical protein
MAAAECGLAYRRGAGTDDATVGALLEADFQAHVRALVKSFTKG